MKNRECLISQKSDNIISDKKKMVSLDIIRGFAMLSVLFTHWSGWTIVCVNDITFFDNVVAFLQGIFKLILWNGNFAHPGVVVFVVLSGFVIHLFNEINVEKLNVKYCTNWYLKRLIRILPVFWICSLVGVVVIVIMYQYSNFVPKYALNDYSNYWNILDVFTQLTISNVLMFKPRHGLANGPLATVELLIIFYLAYPLILKLLNKFGRNKIFLMAFICYLSGIALKHTVCENMSIGILGPMLFFVFWYLGVFFADMIKRPGTQNKKSNKEMLFFVFIALIFFTSSNLIDFNKRYYLIYITSLCFAIACGLLFLAIVKVDSNSNFFQKKPFLFLAIPGKWSFSAFAIHTPIIILTQMIIIKFKLHGDFPERIVPLIMVIICTVIIYVFVEKPSHEFAVKFFNKKTLAKNTFDNKK